MITTALVPSAAFGVSAETSSGSHDLGEAIAQLAAQLHAATYELLVLLRQFDECAGWNTGFLTCAHWLHWRTGFDLGTRREKVRVAKALARLPRISAEMGVGRLSYAKVRALTRVATPDTESALLDLARAGKAAHVERFVRAWRRVDRTASAEQTETRHLNRQLATWVDDDGMVVIRGRLSPEVGAVVQRALEAAADQLHREARDLPKPDQPAGEVTPAQRRADALGLLAEAALTADLDRGSAGDRYQVVLHVEMPTSVAAGERLSGTVEVDHGAVDVSAETLRRTSCDASVVTMHHDAHGAVLDIGRKTRTVPPSIRCTPCRALVGRWRYQRRQSGAVVPTSSSGRARGRIRPHSAPRWPCEVLTPERDRARRGPAVTDYGRQPRCGPRRARPADVGWRSVRSRLGDRRPVQARRIRDTGTLVERGPFA
jgi:hypothetical protein